MNERNDGLEELLSDESVCKADFKTIQLLRKRCRNHEIEVLLKEKYQQYKDTVSKVWDITKDVGNDLLKKRKNVWGNIKSWYENATDKN